MFVMFFVDGFYCCCFFPQGYFLMQIRILCKWPQLEIFCGERQKKENFCLAPLLFHCFTMKTWLINETILSFAMFCT